MSVAVTRGIRVKVEPIYVPGRSAPHKNLYFFAYRVTIENEGDVPVQLMNRHWTITDGTGRVEEVRGPGVVGAQPRLVPGQSFEYTSFCPLSTQVGSMVGSYEMVTDSGETFDVRIAPFTLAVPHALN
jgi:ApaG protein